MSRAKQLRRRARILAAQLRKKNSCKPRMSADKKMALSCCPIVYKVEREKDTVSLNTPWRFQGKAFVTFFEDQSEGKILFYKNNIPLYPLKSHLNVTVLPYRLRR